MTGRLKARRVTLGVCGSIAAYKAAMLARLLVREGAAVRTVMSRSASEFVGASTFSGLTGNRVVTEMFDADFGGERHVELAQWSEALVLAPATADLLARLAGGRADDLLTATALCSSCPIVAAPAMHPAMWSAPATQRTVGTLHQDGRVELIGPVEGEVASGEQGVGRMAEPESVLAAVVAHLSPQDLRGRRVVVTAGPSVEDLDPVRFIGNRSSGKMGFAIAERAAARGAKVTLITGPVERPTPHRVHRVDVRSAVAMRGALWQALGPDLSHADALVMAAAVGDYRPAEVHATKIKRQPGPLTLELSPNPDLLAEVGENRSGKRPVLVGFAVETGSDEAIVRYAKSKLDSKRADLIVANHADESLGRESNRVTLVTGAGTERLDVLPKPAIADRLLDWVATRFHESR